VGTRREAPPPPIFETADFFLKQPRRSDTEPNLLGRAIVDIAGLSLSKLDLLTGLTRVDRTTDLSQELRQISKNMTGDQLISKNAKTVALNAIPPQWLVLLPPGPVLDLSMTRRRYAPGRAMKRGRPPTTGGET
jgi:hypothetical protein